MQGFKKTTMLPYWVAAGQAISFMLYTQVLEFLHFERLRTFNLFFLAGIFQIAALYFIVAAIFVKRTHLRIVLGRLVTDRVGIFIRFFVFSVIVTLFPFLGTLSDHNVAYVPSLFFFVFHLGVTIAFILGMQYASLYFLKKKIGPVDALQVEEKQVAETVSSRNAYPLTYIALWAIAGLVLLEIIPLVNLYVIIFGAMLLGPYVWSSLPHLVTVGVIADVSAKRFPKKALLIPLLAYAAYYAYYVYQYTVEMSIEAQLRAQNPAQIMPYNPAKMDVSIPHGEYLISLLKMPVIYDPAPGLPEGYFAYRIVSPELCQKFKSMRIPWNDGFPIRYGSAGRKFGLQLAQCQIRRPERPTKEILQVSTKEEKKTVDGTTVSITTYEFKYEGKVLGTFKQASVSQLPLLPFFAFGYAPKAFGGESGWYVHAYRHTKALNTFPAGAEEEKFRGNVLATMLKINEYKASDFEKFTDYPENTELINGLVSAKTEHRYRNTDEDPAANAFLKALNNADSSTEELNELFDSYLNSVSRNGASSKENLKIIIKALADMRITQFYGVIAAVRDLSPDSASLAKPLMGRLMKLDKADVVRCLGDAINFLPAGAAVSIAPDLEKLARIPDYRGIASKAIIRLSDIGGAAIPTYEEILQTPMSAYNQKPYAADRDVQLGALKGLCKLGKKAEPAKDILMQYANTVQPQYFENRVMVFEVLANLMPKEQFKAQFGTLIAPRDREIDRYIAAAVNGKCTPWP